MKRSLKTLFAGAPSADPITRAKLAMNAADPVAERVRLLADLSFAASLHVAAPAVVDAVRKIFARSVRTKTLEAAIHSFRHLLRRRAKQASPAIPSLTSIVAIPSSEAEPGSNYSAICGALRRDPVKHVGAALMMNEMTGEVTMNMKALQPQDRTRIQERLEIAFSEEVGRPIKLSGENVERAIDQIASESSFHPVRDYLNKLSWDGVPRLDDLATLVFMTTTLASIEKLLLRLWFISAVARVFRPGTKVDTMLVLVGPQGLLKSTLLKRLAGDDWFSDSTINIHEKDGFLTLRRVWVLEWAELEAISRSRDGDAVKAFLSSSTDTYRPPYGRASMSVPRTSVIVGTTNAEDFLTDATGNRRFWPVRLVSPIDVAAAATLRDQLWAEAVAAFKAGESWHLTAANEAALNVHLSGFEYSDSWEEAVGTVIAVCRFELIAAS